MHETTAVGQDSGSSAGHIWFLPSGVARGERNAHRFRGWAIAISVAVVLWGVIGVVIASLVSWVS